MASLAQPIRTATMIAQRSALSSYLPAATCQCLYQSRSIIQPRRHILPVSSNIVNRTQSTTANPPSPPVGLDEKQANGVTPRQEGIINKFLEDLEKEQLELAENEGKNPYIPDPPEGQEDDDQHDPYIPDWNNDDVSSIAHGEIEQHREFRHYARLAMWEMPRLAQLAKPFKPPGPDDILRFRYTSYMGVDHPAENKVVMEVDTKKLRFFTKAQKTTLYKLVGQRYNPSTETIKFSCEMFEQQAQNKRYLSDLFDKLIDEVKHGKDDFADIPLDLSYHKRKEPPKFPKEWLMTPAKMLKKRRKDWRGATEDEKEEMLLAASEHVGKTVKL